MANKQSESKNINCLIIAAAVIICVAVAVIVGVSFANRTDNGDDNANDASAVVEDTAADDAEESTDTYDADVQVISEGESLIIPTSDISSTAVFYTVEVDGTEMEVLAVADSEGNIRTAFNTCQICYGSGRGYYVQDGDELICQNCGNRFTVDQVEVQSGSCNPWPIFEENKTVTDDYIEISYDFLSESKAIFENWKTLY